jgi:hypothetical protein
VAEEVKQWVTENNQVGAKELQKNIKEKCNIDLLYMRVFNGKQQAMDSIYGNDCGQMTTQLGTPRGRYDDHSSKSSLSKKSRFIEPVGKG